MEKYKKGGYTILDLESSTIYADSVKALDSNKPVVVYDGTNAPYFADTISLDGTNVVITKGGKTITIANDNTITSVGGINTFTTNIYLYHIDLENLGGTGEFFRFELYSQTDYEITTLDDLKQLLIDEGYTGADTNDLKNYKTGIGYISSSYRYQIGVNLGSDKIFTTDRGANSSAIPTIATLYVKKQLI